LYFDLVDSIVTATEPTHPHYASGVTATTIADLLQVRQPEELAQFTLNREQRRTLLHVMEQYYQQHIQDFGLLKTLPVLREILS
jgi:DNA repair protein RecO (recombination protein O)